MIGVLTSGLKRYHQITRDPRVAKCIVRAIDYLIDANWIPQQRVFRYTDCPHIWANAGQNTQTIEGTAYAWRLSQSPKIGRVLINSIEECFTASPGAIGSVSLWMRQIPFAVLDYQDAKASLSKD